MGREAMSVPPHILGGRISQLVWRPATGVVRAPARPARRPAERNGKDARVHQGDLSADGAPLRSVGRVARRNRRVACGRIFLEGDSWPTVSPLTPALSPLRGEGVAMHPATMGQRSAAHGTFAP